MHAPRRSHAAPHLTNVSASPILQVPGGSSIPDNHSLNPRSSYRFPVETNSNGRGDVHHSLSSLAHRHPQVVSTPSFQPAPTLLRRQNSARALWRRRAPRQMPAAALSLLPSISSRSSLAREKLLRPEREAVQPCTVSPSTDNQVAETFRESGKPVLSQAECTNDGDDGHYDGEYVRLLFSPLGKSRTSGFVDTGAVAEGRDRVEGDSSAGNAVTRDTHFTHEGADVCSETSSLHNRSDSTCSGVITSSRASAAIERLPEIPASQRGKARSSKAMVLTSARAAAVQGSPTPTLPSCGKTTIALVDDGAIPKTEAWWSTLDGTLSATNTLLEDESKRLYRAAESSISENVRLSLATASLNETLGRADRAAIVLSMHLGAHTGSNAGEAVESGLERTTDSDVHVDLCGTGRTTKGEEARTDAIAALAMQLSRVAAKCSLSGGCNGAGSTMVSDVSVRGAGQSTLQALRDTMRLTGPVSNQRDTPALHRAPSWLDTPEEGCGLLLSADRASEPSPAESVLLSKAHNQATNDATHSHNTSQDDRVGAPEGGMGAPRIRNVSPRQYPTPDVSASAQAVTSPSSLSGVSLAEPPGNNTARRSTPRKILGSCSVSSANDNGAPKTSSPVVKVATDARTGIGEEAAGLPVNKESLTFAELCGVSPPFHSHTTAAAAADSLLTSPWNTEPLTLKAIKRRHGSLTAIHASQRRRSHDSDGCGRLHTAGHAQHSGRKGAQMQLLSPAASSVSTSRFSVASLTSTMFNRELGEGVAARQRFSKNRYRPAALRTAVPSASGDAVPPLQSNDPQGMTSEEAAAEAYWQQQVRLYASHLVTPSKLRTDESIAAENDLLDVDNLFSDVKRASVDDGKRNVHFGEMPIVGAVAGTKEGDKVPREKTASDAVGTKGKVRASKLTAVASTPLNSLDRAVKARTTFLTRYVKDRSAWNRLLQLVRKWCDRTRVMVRFKNGVCLEQSGSGPLHPTVARHLRQRTLQQGKEATPRINSGGTEADAGKPDADAGDEDDGWNEFVYVDDPATAHDAVMQRLAEKEHDVLWRNALRRCRERRHVSLADEWVGDDAHAAPPGACERRGGRGKALGQAASVVPLSHQAEDREAPRLLSWSSWDADVRHSSVTSPLRGSQHGSRSSLSLPDVMSARGSKMYASGDGGLPAVLQERSSMHADLCARLQTWGTSLSGDDEALPGEDQTTTDTAASSPKVGLGNGRHDCPGRLTWKGTRGRNVPCSTRVASISSHPEVLCQNPSTEILAGEPNCSVEGMPSGQALPDPLVGPRRVSTGQCFSNSFTKIERDLLSFVLISSSGGGPREHLEVLFPLCHSRENERGAEEHHLDEATDAGGLSASRLPPALAALHTIMIELSDSRSGDSIAADPARSSRIDSGGAMGASSLLSPRVTGEKSLLRRTTGLHEDAETEVGCTTNDHNSSTQKRKSQAAIPANPVSTDAATPQKVAPPWGALITSLLGGYNSLDLIFLRQLHLLLLQYESLQRKRAQVTSSEVRGSLVAQGELASVAAPPIRASFPLQGTRRTVCPIALHLSTLQEAEEAAGTNRRRSERGPRILSTVLVDAADLLDAIAATPLLRWVCNLSRQSPTSGLAEIVDAVPETCASHWHNALAQCIMAASSLGSSSLSGEVRQRRSQCGAEPASAITPFYHPHQLESFSCDTAVAMANVEWRLRQLHDVLHRASALAEQNQYQESGNLTTGVDGAGPLGTGGASGSSAGAFPYVGETPYLPGDAARNRYPLDMRNLYLLSALGVEDVDARVVPQLRKARSQYADALRAATAALISVNVFEGPRVSVLSPLCLPKPAASLSLALQQRVHLDRLCGIENRFFAQLSALWKLERTIHSFNQHVAAFNAFTAAEKARWGPLYCSSLKVAYFVCEELAEKGIENISMELLSFVPIVAAFAGCHGGHRELLSKLDTIMLELCERAKKVQVPLESLSFQKKRAQVISEAVEASQLSSRRAAAAVSCLATEADVVGPPLLELAMPSLRLTDVLPLSSFPSST